MEELKLIVELLKEVSDNALWGVIAYLIFEFLRLPVIIATIGYCVKVIINSFKVEVIKNGGGNE